MKKLLFSLAFFTCLFATNLASASTYKVDEAAVDQLFSASDDVTFTASEEAYALMNPSTQAVTKDKTVGGYLLRAFFCGEFALHRYYMGTGGKKLFWYYFCIPVVGGVTACVDFWWVVFKGSDAMNKYADNSKFIVWTGN
jgi:TM2 domain-containing membrane protein YozV